MVICFYIWFYNTVVGCSKNLEERIWQKLEFITHYTPINNKGPIYCFVIMVGQKVISFLFATFLTSYHNIKETLYFYSKFWSLFFYMVNIPKLWQVVLKLKLLMPRYKL